MTREIIAGLLAVNLTAIVAIILVLALRQPVRRMFGARLAYSLWLIVPLAAIAVLIPRPASLSALPQITVPAMVEPVIIRWEQLEQLSPPTAADASAHARTPAVDIHTLVIAAWLVGALAALTAALRAHRRGIARFGRLSRVMGEPLVRRADQPGLGPALIGVIKPKLVLPADFEERYDARERAMVLAHERSHDATGDVRINAVVVVLTCLNWFNPLVHLAAFYVRVDQELACDAAVMARFPGERRTYAEALLKTQLATGSLPLGCYWPGRSSNLLRERLEMLSSSIPGRTRRLAGVTAVSALALSAGYSAWATQLVTPPAVAANQPFVSKVVSTILPLHPQDLAVAETPAPLTIPASDDYTVDEISVLPLNPGEIETARARAAARGSPRYGLQQMLASGRLTSQYLSDYVAASDDAPAVIRDPVAPGMIVDVMTQYTFPNGEVWTPDVMAIRGRVVLQARGRAFGATYQTGQSADGRIQLSRVMVFDEEPILVKNLRIASGDTANVPLPNGIIMTITPRLRPMTEAEKADADARGDRYPEFALQAAAVSPVAPSPAARAAQAQASTDTPAASTRPTT